MDDHSSSYCLEQQCDDIDAFNEVVQHWDLDFSQLDSGPMGADILQAGTDRAHLAQASFSSTIDQRGIAPIEGRTFGVLAVPMEVDWCTQNFTHNNIAVFNPSGSFESVSRRGFKVYTLTFTENHLQTLLEDLELPDTSRYFGKTESVWEAGSPVINQLRLNLQVLMAHLSDMRQATLTPALSEYMEFDIPRQLIELFNASTRAPKAPSPGLRRRAYEAAVDYIRCSNDDLIKAADLVAVSGASERTLEYAFKEFCGMTPKQYTKAYRFNCVRKRLKHANPAFTTVADVAGRWGFWHMSQFASDYKQLFGELPSTTLRKLSG